MPQISNKKQMKKLGILVQYCDTRKDVPLLIKELSEFFEVVLFGSHSELKKVDLCLEKRTIQPRKRNLHNRTLNVLYACFGSLPYSRKNFENWLRYRRRKIKSPSLRFRQSIIDWLRIHCGNLLKFDSYVRWLEGSDNAKINDIDFFLSLTDLCNVALVSEILSAKKTYLTYVYSWDHVAKQHQYLKHGTHYLTWHHGMTQDLIREHNICANRISVVGSSQMALVEPSIKRAKDNPTSTPKDYVYYGASTGAPEFAEQEKLVIKFIAECLKKISPSTTLLVRPYPFAIEMNLYGDLLQLQNVRIDNISASDGSILFQQDSMEEKYGKIRDAKIFMHMGSTIGLEAAYFSTPTVMLAMEDFDYGIAPENPRHLPKLFDQPHIQNYLLSSSEPNIIRTEGQLLPRLLVMMKDPHKFLNYNKEFQNTLPLSSMREIAVAISNVTGDNPN
ncbi:hypothetical protein N9061_00150 [bacterium]|nr:hypothetical protein [bacterium]